MESKTKLTDKSEVNTIKTKRTKDSSIQNTKKTGNIGASKNTIKDRIITLLKYFLIDNLIIGLIKSTRTT